MKYTTLLLLHIYKSTQGNHRYQCTILKSRFIPYFKTSFQATPTGTMMGEIGVQGFEHKFHVIANETTAVLDGREVDMRNDWDVSFNGVTFYNQARKGNMYEFTVETEDITITFIRRVYIVTGLERQWHYDYKAKLMNEGNALHG